MCYGTGTHHNEVCEMLFWFPLFIPHASEKTTGADSKENADVKYIAKKTVYKTKRA